MKYVYKILYKNKIMWCEDGFIYYQDLENGKIEKEKAEIHEVTDITLEYESIGKTGIIKAYKHDRLVAACIDGNWI